MEYVPKEITEEVNVTPIHPLKYFAKVCLILSSLGLVFYGVSGAISDQVAQVLDPTLEAKIGKILASSVSAQNIRPDDEKKLQQLLDELQDQQNIRQPRAEIHLIESKQVNAGVLPGGQMIMTTGLLDDVKSENELAFVLAHELGHHQLRHPSRRLGRSLLWLVLLSILGIGQQTTPAVNPTAPKEILDLQFSRTQEQASDRFALSMVEARYGHVDHALDFFRRLQDQELDPISENVQIEFLQTHPFPKNRVRDLERYANQQQWSLEGMATNLE